MEHAIQVLEYALVQRIFFQIFTIFFLPKSYKVIGLQRIVQFTHIVVHQIVMLMVRAITLMVYAVVGQDTLVMIVVLHLFLVQITVVMLVYVIVVLEFALAIITIQEMIVLF